MCCIVGLHCVIWLDSIFKEIQKLGYWIRFTNSCRVRASSTLQDKECWVPRRILLLPCSDVLSMSTCWFVGNKIFKKPMILCARSTSRSREQSKKRRSRSENMRKDCLFYSHNNKILWLSNMAETLFEEFRRCAKVCGRFYRDCAFRMLIGWADKLWSRGCNCPISRFHESVYFRKHQISTMSEHWNVEYIVTYLSRPNNSRCNLFFALHTGIVYDIIRYADLKSKCMHWSVDDSPPKVRVVKLDTPKSDYRERLEPSG